MDVLSIVPSLIIAILSCLVPIALIGVLLYLVFKKNQPQTDKKADHVPAPTGNIFSLKNLIKLYLYIIVSISSLILIIGLSILGKVVFGTIDQNFSYGFDAASEDYTTTNTIPPTTPVYDYLNGTGTTKPYIMPPVPTSVPSNYKCYDPDTQITYVGVKAYCTKPSEVKMDLINGITITMSMLLIFCIHLFILIKMESENASRNLRKFFDFSNLIFYSGSSLILIPVAIYQTMNYLVLAQKPVATYNTPGMLVAFAVFSFIAWMVWLGVVLKNKDPEAK